MAILLAAGGSHRFGRRDKLLATLRGRTLLDHALDNALDATEGRVLAVVASRDGRIARAVRRRADRRLTLVVARAHARGMGASLAAGLAAIRPIERELLVFLGDMPGARAPRGLRLPPGHDAARPVADGGPGHPMLVRAAAAKAAGIGADDRGLAGRLDPARILSVRGSVAAGCDIDTPAALRRARLQGTMRCWK